MDVFVEGRPSQGLMWGPWRVGMAVTNPQIQSRFEKAGLAMLSPKLGIQLLADVMRQTEQVCTPVVAEVAWAKLFRPDQDVPSLFSEIVMRKRQDKLGGPAAVSAVSPTEDVEGIGSKIRAIVVGMLGGDIAPDQVNTLSFISLVLL